MKRKPTLMLAAIAASLILGPTAGADPIRVELTDPSRPGRLDVEIEWGSIRITAGAEVDTLTITVRPDLADELAGALVEVSESDNLVTIRQAPLSSGTFRSANLEIATPLHTSARLQINRGGDIWARGLDGVVEVTNLNGSVELSEIAGAAAVNASNGAITAGFSRVDQGKDMFFGSLNGSVELCLPPDFSARLNLTTAGDPIRSDFEIEREDQVRTVAPGGTLTVNQSEVRGRVGTSQSRLRISTLNGEISLKRCD